jgi:hypothetical protein
MNQLQITQINFDMVLTKIQNNDVDNMFVVEFIGDKPDIYCAKDRSVKELIEDDKDPNTIFVMAYPKSCEGNEEEE